MRREPGVRIYAASVFDELVSFQELFFAADGDRLQVKTRLMENVDDAKVIAAIKLACAGKEDELAKVDISGCGLFADPKLIDYALNAGVEAAKNLKGQPRSAVQRLKLVFDLTTKLSRNYGRDFFKERTDLGRWNTAWTNVEPSTYLPALSLLASSMKAAGRGTDTLEILQQVVDGDSTNPQAHLALGDTLYDDGHEHIAQDSYKEYCRLMRAGGAEAQRFQNESWTG